eukprot:84999-Prorocentrum_lima.AAC.1
MPCWLWMTSSSFCRVARRPTCEQAKQAKQAMQAMQAMQARRGRFPGVEEEHVRSIILFSGAKGLVALCCSSAKPDTYHRT